MTALAIATRAVMLLVLVVLGMELLAIACQLWLPGGFSDPLCGRNCYSVTWR